MSELDGEIGQSELILYQTQDQQTMVEVRLDGDTVWLSQGQMAELFQRNKSVISRHTLGTFTLRETSNTLQLLQNLQQFKLKVTATSYAISSSTISTSLFPSDIVSNP